MKKRLKLELLFVYLFCITMLCKAQAPPAIEWQSTTWLDKDILGNNVSWIAGSQDWWYDNCTGYTSPATKTGFLGYFACGYSFYKEPYLYDETNVAYGIYNNGCTIENSANNSGYDFGSFENCQVGRLGLAVNTIGRIDGNGNKSWLLPLNVVGQDYTVKQLSDGNFMTVGFTIATRKRLISPYNGTPLYYNPTVLNPNDYFINTQIFTGGPNVQESRARWDVMKFDANGNEIFNNIYGVYDFDLIPNSNYNYGAFTNQTGAQLAYRGGYEAWDFIEDPTNNNIVVVGTCLDYLSNMTEKAAIIKLNASGQVISKGFLTPATIGNANIASSARGIAYVNISGTDYYIVSYRETDLTTGQTDVKVMALPANFTTSSPPLFNVTSSPLWSITLTSTNLAPPFNSISYGMFIKSGFVYLPLITNCNNCQFTADNIGDLKVLKIDVSNGNIIAQPIVKSVAAYDIKARITELFSGSGGIGVISSSKTVPWTSICSTANIPSYMYGGGVCGSGTLPANFTDWWNSDAYVAKLDFNCNTIWDKTFDVNHPFSCTSFPVSPVNGSGNVKRQECMYGISEAPDGGVVVSGNNSHDWDDNYMVKLYSDCSQNIAYNVTGPGNVITTLTNLNNGDKVLGSIEVQSGQVLNVAAGAVIQFADSKQTGITTNIVVKPGGKLIVGDGAVLTSILTCPSAMWDGIKIEGDASPQNLTANHGIVHLNGLTTTAGVKIENARVALQNIHVSTQLPGGGGYVKGNSVTFLNNDIDVSLKNYTHLIGPTTVANQTAFQNCKFTGDALLKDPIYTAVVAGNTVRRTTDRHVVLTNVGMVTFKGCTFLTDVSPLKLTSAYPSELRSYGIDATDGCVRFIPYCTPVVSGGPCVGFSAPAVFENLRQAVFSTSTLLRRNIIVEQSTIRNCYRGIYQSGAAYNDVNRNSFVNNTLLPSIPTLDLYDTYLTGADRYGHKENVHTTVNQTLDHYGTIFDFSGINSNLSYKNDYTGFDFGSQTQLQNALNNSTYNGLQLQCNTYISSTNTDIFQTSGTLGWQGTCFSALSTANDRFTNSAAIASLKSSSTGFDYYYNPLPVVPGTQVPSISSGVNSINCTGPLGNFAYNTHCPTKYPTTPCGLPCQQSNVSSARQSATDAQQPLLEGDSPTLHNAISGNMSFGNMENLLLSESPYLSDAVMMEYLQHPQTPPYGHIKEVIIANSPVTAPVMSELNNMNLPSGVINQINDAQVGISPRKEQENLVAYYFGQEDEALGNVIEAFLTDSIIHEDSIAKWLEYSTNLVNKIPLVETYVNMGKFDQARSLALTIQSNRELTVAGAFLERYVQLSQTNRTWDEMKTNEALLEFVKVLSTTNGYGARLAQNALRLVFGDPAYEVIEKPSDSGAKLAKPAKTLLSNGNYEYDSSVLAFPNPFNNELNVSYNLDARYKNGNLAIIEPASGRVLMNYPLSELIGSTVIKTENLAAGVYMVRISGSDAPEKFIKIVNIK